METHTHCNSPGLVPFCSSDQFSPLFLSYHEPISFSRLESMRKKIVQLPTGVNVSSIQPRT